MSQLCRSTPAHIIETKLGLYSREIQPIRQHFGNLYFQLHYAHKYRYNICRPLNTLLLSLVPFQNYTNIKEKKIKRNENEN